MITIKVKKMKFSKLMISCILTASMLCSCKTSDDKNSSQNSTSEPEQSVSQLETSGTTAADNSEKYDFSKLASGKYAEVFAQQKAGTKYTLKWKYEGEYADKETNYIYCDASKGRCALNITRPLFNEMKFILKDHTMYDIYDADQEFAQTDMTDMARESGYIVLDEFERYASDIFWGMFYLGTDKETVDGKEYTYDAYYTTSQVELRLLTDDDGKLVAIKAIHDGSDDAYMFIEEFTEDCPEDVFEIPDKYTERKSES